MTVTSKVLKTLGVLLLACLTWAPAQTWASSRGDRIVGTPVAYTYQVPGDVTRDGRPLRWFGVYVRLDAGLRGPFTGLQLRRANVLMEEVGSRETGLLSRLPSLRRPGLSPRRFCAQAQFHVPVSHAGLGSRRPGDRVRIKLRFPGRAAATAAATLRRGRINASSATGRAAIAALGCRAWKLPG